MTTSTFTLPKSKSITMYIIILALFFIPSVLKASASEDPSLLGNWIKVDIIYLDGSALEEHHSLKYSFLKYSFKPGKQAAIITDFLSVGEFNPYKEKNGTIEISTKFGAVVKLKMVYLSNDSLVMIQEDSLRPNNPNSLVITLVRYDHLQKTAKWSAQDYIYSPSTDTIYKASQKIHPIFSNPNGFKNSLQKHIKSYSKYMSGSSEDKLFFATFIVSKSGTVENIRIIQGLDDGFNKQFVAACKKTEKMWTPAYFNNEPVNVQVTLEINFDFLNQFKNDHIYNMHAIRQIKKGNIEGAIAYMDKLLSFNPKNEKALLFRAQCYLELNNLESACEDFRILKNLGFASGEALLEKYCQ